MKALVSGFLAGMVAFSAFAQYKAPSQYFRRDFPAAPKAGQQQQAQPQTPPQQTPPAPKAPEKPVQPKFKDVPLNTQFFFLTDTNRAYPWTKISSSTATNTKNGAMHSFSGEIPVQR